MKALVTGAAGFIGSHLAERCSIAGARSSGSTASPTTTRGALKEREPRRRSRRAPGFRFVESDAPGRRPGGAARRRDARLPPGRAGRRAQELGPRLHAPTPSTTSTRRRCCSRRASAGRSSGSSTPRARRSTATPRRSRCARTRCRSRSRRTASPSWRPSSSCYLYLVNYGVPAVALRYFTVYGPRQRPDMGFHRFLARRASRRADHACTATASRRAISPSWPTRSTATHRGRRARRARAASTTSAAARACR